MARERARLLAGQWAPDARQAQIAAYRVMLEADLLAIGTVQIQPGWLDRRRARVPVHRAVLSMNDPG